MCGCGLYGDRILEKSVIGYLYDFKVLEIKIIRRNWEIIVEVWKDKVWFW